MPKKNISTTQVPLERDLFLRSLLNHLSGSLEETIGLEEASGFIAEVGQRIGREMNEAYTRSLDLNSLDRQTVAAVLVDLKKRIQGDFYILEESDEKIVFGNRKCPFEDKVKGRPSLCMMTSNVFGTIAANNLGYAKVVLDETIAQGHAGCKVSVYLKKVNALDSKKGREYFGD